jgi:hypothetical protein
MHVFPFSKVSLSGKHMLHLVVNGRYLNRASKEGLLQPEKTEKPIKQKNLLKMRQESMTKDRIKDKTEPYNSENMNTQDPI